MTLFWSLNKLSGRTLLSSKFHCRVDERSTFYNPRPSLSTFTLMLIILPLKFYAGRQLHGYFEMLRTTKTSNMLNEISTQQQKA